MKTRTSRIANQEPINISKLIAICLFFGLATMAFFNHRISKELARVNSELSRLNKSIK